MYKPTLVILAAGWGTRYGGLKQIDSVGPNGEILIEYSIYNALRQVSESSFLLFSTVSRMHSRIKSVPSSTVLLRPPMHIRKLIRVLGESSCRLGVRSPGVRAMRSLSPMTL